MKSKLALIVSMFALNVFSVQVLWVGIGDGAIVQKGGIQYSIEQFATSIGQPMENMGGRIVIEGNPMLAGFEDPTGYVPPGQAAPSIIWEFEGESLTDFNLGDSKVENGEYIWNGGYADWQPIRLDETDKLAEVIFEIGYWDDEWNFITLGESEVSSLGDLWDDHTFPTGSLAPPDFVPWRPDVFYVPVPEPSFMTFFFLGICAFLIRRKWNGA